jgi:HEAT repeat protein
LFWVLTAIVAVNLLFLWVVLERRLRLQRYFVIKDSARASAGHQVRAFLEGSITLEDLLGLRREMTTRAAREAVHDLLFVARTPGTIDRISEAVFALRSVDDWAVQAFGRRRARPLVASAIRRELPAAPGARRLGAIDRVRRLRVFSVPRALAVSQLAQLAPEFAQVFLVEATADPATEVRQIAITAMGDSRHPPLIPYLMAELARSIDETSDVSLRTVKIALTSFRLRDLERFVPFLLHPNPHLRLAVVDIAGQITGEAARGGMLNKNDFSPEFYAAFLDRLVDDDSADVRARAALVVRHFRDQRAIGALRRLMNDDNDFVRLHAVRACADRFFMDLLPHIARRLRDPHWRVRDAAVKSILAFGSSGLTELYRVFLESDDQETAQQITDGLQRVGGMPSLLAALSTGGVQSGLVTAVCQKMALLGNTVYLNRALASLDDAEVRLRLMDALMTAPDEKYLTVLQTLTSSQHHAVRNRASEILRQSGISSGGRPADA